ncbi:hypothetical protein ACT3TY_15390 [Halomonas sp. AOP22-C1-8]|uniref:hypothetical protein n=1 Tax=Halomonas sp. AOP22-C1-8 TaxID=3457717 RepID=UPI004034303D
MSLESQITALVSAANKLTSEVANKMRGIDQKVSEAVKAIPNLARTYHIDAVLGSDSNSGGDSAPLATIREALMRSGDIPFVTIRLHNGQVHEFRGREDSSHIYHQVRNRVAFRSYGGPGASPIIEPVVTTSVDGNNSLMHFLAIEDGGAVNGQKVVLKLAQGLDAANSPKLSIGVGGAFIGRAHGRPVGSGHFVWSDGDIILSEHYALLASSIAGNYSVSLDTLNIDDPSGTGASRFIDLGNRLTLNFAVNGVTLAASMGSFGECIINKPLATDGQPINVTSTVDLTA